MAVQKNVIAYRAATRYLTRNPPKKEGIDYGLTSFPCQARNDGREAVFESFAHSDKPERGVASSASRWHCGYEDSALWALRTAFAGETPVLKGHILANADFQFITVCERSVAYGSAKYRTPARKGATLPSPLQTEERE